MTPESSGTIAAVETNTIGGPRIGPTREPLIENFGAAEEGEIVRPVADAVEGRVEIVWMKFDPPFRPKQRRPDRPAEVEEKAGGAAVGRLAEQPRTRDAAAADDVVRLDVIDDRAGAHGAGPREDYRQRHGNQKMSAQL